MGMPDTIRWTRDQVLNLPGDGNRYELVDGELVVTPAPTWHHQRVLAAILRVIDPYLEAGGFGHVLWSPADLELESGQLTQPDIFVLPGSGPVQRWEEAPRPLLVIEALSPSTARYDRGLKRRFYQRAGVPEYWIVDIDARVVERWRPDDSRPEVLDATLEWAPLEGVPALVIAVPSLFEAS